MRFSSTVQVAMMISRMLRAIFMKCIGMCSMKWRQRKRNTALLTGYGAPALVLSPCCSHLGFLQTFKTPPPFGDSTTPYSEVDKFYRFWCTYSTVMSFAWCDEYRLSEAENRRVRRYMEKENKTVSSLGGHTRRRPSLMKLCCWKCGLAAPRQSKKEQE